jgi:signal transduction histidine kinase
MVASFARQLQTVAVPDNLTAADGDRDPGNRAAPPLRSFLWFGLRGWAAIAFLAAAQLLLVGLAATSVNTPSRLIAALALALAPIIGVAVAISAIQRRRGPRPSDLDDLSTLVSRVELAEAILAREQERMHELRATVSSVALSHRLLSDSGAKLCRATRWRLERLRETELGRIERLLADGPKETVGAVDLTRVLDPLVDSVRMRGHEVVWTGTRRLGVGRADDISEIVHILLENAIRHAGGNQIEVEVAGGPERIELRVSDAGPGVPAALAPNVFDRDIRTATSRGEGIGLHIARRLARDLGGDLRLESSPTATGASFVLQLLDPAGGATCLARAV